MKTKNKFGGRGCCFWFYTCPLLPQFATEKKKKNESYKT